MLTSLFCTMLFFKSKPQTVPQETQNVTSWHEFSAIDIDGAPKKMSVYKGKTVLVVNTASECGLTPQYEALEAAYQKYKDKGFVVVGFPCNDFGGQEPGNEAQIKEFCNTQYKVSFPMFSKVHVKGEQQSPMFSWLIWKSGGKDIEWNFGKFLIGKDGQLIKRFGSRTKPDDNDVVSEIEKALSTQH